MQFARCSVLQKLSTFGKCQMKSTAITYVSKTMDIVWYFPFNFVLVQSFWANKILIQFLPPFFQSVWNWELLIVSFSVVFVILPRSPIFLSISELIAVSSGRGHYLKKIKFIFWRGNGSNPWFRHGRYYHDILTFNIA